MHDGIWHSNPLLGDLYSQLYPDQLRHHSPFHSSQTETGREKRRRDRRRSFVRALRAHSRRPEEVGAGSRPQLRGRDHAHREKNPRRCRRPNLRALPKMEAEVRDREYLFDDSGGYHNSINVDDDGDDDDDDDDYY